MTWVGILRGLVRGVLRSARSRLAYPLLDRMGSARWAGSSVRLRALRARGVLAGDGVRIGSNIRVETAGLVLGSDSIVGDNVAFLGLAHIDVQTGALVESGSSVGDVRVSVGGSGLAIHHPVVVTRDDRDAGRPTTSRRNESAKEADNGTD